MNYTGFIDHLGGSIQARHCLSPRTLTHRGAVAISVEVNGAFGGWKPDDDVNLDKGYLGRGLSVSKGKEKKFATNHAIILVGFGPCKVLSYSHDFY